MALMDEDTYVEKFVLKNRLALPPEVRQAKAVAQQRGILLLQVLQEQTVIDAEQVAAIRKLYERFQVSEGKLAATGASNHKDASEPSTGYDTAVLDLSKTVILPAVRPSAVFLRTSQRTDNIASFTNMRQYLKLARDVGASDIHINTGSPPVIRKDGKLLLQNRAPFTAEETEKLLFGILDEEQRRTLLEKKSCDFCCEFLDQGRYRSCIVKQRNGWDGAFRVINSEVPRFEDLALPLSLKRLTEFNQGLVLITGPNGCGKSTTMAALIDLINESRQEHIITIEDPIEYIFKPKKCQVNQREVGTSTRSFVNALRSALREDPDVIMIGELRDRETVSLAISAAETGHLVFGTLHTTSAARTIDRVLDVFPPDEQSQIRNMVSESIKGIVCQQLIPCKDGNGRVLALEILFNNAACGNLIRERRMYQLPSVMQSGRRQGMVLMDDALTKLVQGGIIHGIDAYFAADDRSKFEQWAPKVT